MRRLKQWIGVTLSFSFLLGAVLNVACSSSVWAGAEPYKIGAVFSITGVASFLGEPEKKTAEMIVEEVNKKGGINGHPIELIVYDDESDATKCNLAVKKLIKRDQVPVIIGPTRSGESLAVLSVAEEAQIPLISCATSYKIVTPIESRKWIFKVAGSDKHVVGKLYDYMKAKGIQKVAIMTDSTGYGASGREELLGLAPEYGITIVADERFGPQDTDLTPQLTKIRGTQPQAIVNWSVGPTQILAIKNWRDLGMDAIPLYQSHGFGSLKNLELAGKAAEGVLLPLARVNVGPLLADDQPQKKVIMEYTKAYEEKYKEPISSFGGHAWDATQLALAALQAVGPDPAKIRDHIENTKNFIGMHGIFNFSPQDHNGLSKEDLEMVIVKDGNWALAPW
ncbi:ABC transporter substrate-binding protein [Desulforhabdus amnigena]|jgi:branched-chain amino acid transport system substrate-binding protein|uniref:Branched-chain amino acid ABC transporter substrate-binding protein n=1 Tax=Desulforhabdus amnigena TaxID=40218 RepID=A0A9W6FVI2_9BACT|nr:ABC transporter substrate-binding protein [Desulforhabdus amnigena]NLJ28930.1 ABC transporter substrate-binding protein [Deltaproteobacteria bacterium]GLI35666.1 branched-chain amino acid ABC transporter substrate-binding protein [Desulforhabdus amnigena]